MGFSLSGNVADGAASALEELLTRQLEEAKFKEAKRAREAQEGQSRDRLAFDRERFTADQDARQQDIEQASIDGLRKNTDRMDARMTRLQGEQDAMDVEARRKAVLDALPPQLRTVVELGGKLSSDDLKTDDQRRAEEDAAVRRAGRIAAAQRGPAKPTGGPNAEIADKGESGANIARLARDLKAHAGFKNVFGSVQGALPSFTQESVDAEALRDSLISSLTLENVSKLKGVLSDRDMEVLMKASTSLRPRMGDAAAAAELDRIISIFDRAGGAQPMPSHETAPPPGQPQIDPRYAQYLRNRGRK